MGKPKKTQRSREAIRLQALISQLEQDGLSQSEIARRMNAVAQDGEAVHTSYINLHRRGDRAGVGAAIIRMVKDAFNVDPDYFFDDYEGVKDHKLYYLDERRVEKQLRELRAESEKQLTELQSQIAAIREAQLKTEVELAEVTKKPRPALVTPPTRKVPRTER